MMKVIEILVLVLLLTTLAFSLYVLWLNFPSEVEQFKQSKLESFNINVTSNGIQFYPNMRYPDKEISYRIDSACSDSKKQEIFGAFNTLSGRTVLSFYETSKAGQIRILCSDVTPEPERKNYFVAGEGGPTQIINTSAYYLINSGEISLFRPDKCSEPKVALHELLHALGFDHNSNQSSVMYPVTNCNQQLDEYIVEEINRLYSIPSESDLAILSVDGSKSGRYLSFNIVVSNIGLKDSKEADLFIFVDETEVKKFNLGLIPVGISKNLSVQNLRIQKDIKEVRFFINDTSVDNEISDRNNEAIISL